MNNYGSHFSDAGFWSKVKLKSKTIGKNVLEPAFTLYQSLKDKDTPVWARATIVAALGYFISPVDAIPDPVLFFGYSDDLGVISTAMTAVYSHIKNEHSRMAAELLDDIFS